MKIYPLNETSRVAHPEFGEFEAQEDGGFDLPHDFALQLHGTHVGGQKAWETDGERSKRLVEEELERRRDPATLLAAFEELITAQKASAEPPAAPAEPAGKAPAAPKRPSRPTAARK